MIIAVNVFGFVLFGMILDLRDCIVKKAFGRKGSEEHG